MSLKEHSSRAAHRPNAMEVPPATAIPARQPQILLVDDDNVVLESLAEVLTQEGFLVRPATNGDEAITVAAALPVDLVILDLNMPGRTGWDTFERLSAEHPLLPIIIATARPLQLFTALSAGVGALLEKPLDIADLLKTIRRLLAEPSETRLRRLVGQQAPFHFSPSRG
jgi:two-component system phosphate regulon response regulator PhoB